MYNYGLPLSLPPSLPLSLSSLQKAYNSLHHNPITTSIKVGVSVILPLTMYLILPRYMYMYYTCTCICVQMCIPTIRQCKYMYVYMCTHVYAYNVLYMCMYVYICAHICMPAMYCTCAFKHFQWEISVYVCVIVHVPLGT